MSKELTEIFQKRQTEQVEKRQAAMQFYLALLKRHDSLSGEDEFKLLQAMECLGFTEANVLADVEAIKRTAELTPLSLEVELRLNAIGEAQRALSAHTEAERAYLVESDRQRAELTAALARASGAHQMAFDATAEVNRLRQSHAHLFT